MRSFAVKAERRAMYEKQWLFPCFRIPIANIHE
jgi:hypothetical protein